MTPEQPDLRPPGTRPEADSRSGGRHVFVGLMLLLLVGLALAVVVLLPQYTQPDQPVSSAAPATAPEPPPRAPTAPAVAEAKVQAEGALRDYLRLRARLELENAPVWGDPEWDLAAADVKQGDRLFLQNEFSAAVAAYGQGIARLEALDVDKPRRLDQALRDGAQALDQERIADALDRFERALAIAPDHAQAREGLARASVREEVLTLMAAGQQAESRGETEAAQGAYGQANALDQDYLPAVEAMQRVAAQIEAVAFQSAMDQALAALEAGRFAVAAQALTTAAALRPGDASVRDLHRRLDTARKQQALANWRNTAQARASGEDWQGALEAYQQALKVDPNAGFAVAGVDQSRARLRLHRQIDHYLADPARLAGEEPLANAEQVLQAAGEAPVGQPGLAGKIDRLRQLVAQARTPVSIELRSDGETDVVIYHVGRQGRFQRKQLVLRPGTYTAVGSRPGYRDVRRQFEVRTDGPPLVVTIRCEEAI